MPYPGLGDGRRSRRGPTERQLRRMYAAAELDRRLHEPEQRRISFAAFKRLVRIQAAMRATDPGGNIVL